MMPDSATVWPSAQGVGQRPVQQAHHGEGEEVDRDDLLGGDSIDGELALDRREAREDRVDRERPQHGQGRQQDDDSSVRCSADDHSSTLRRVATAARSGPPDDSPAHRALGVSAVSGDGCGAARGQGELTDSMRTWRKTAAAWAS